MIDFVLHMACQIVIMLFALFASVNIMVSRMSDAGVFLKFVALIVLIMTLWMVFRRDTYLPFLGYAAFPKSLIPNDFAPVNSNTEITVPFNAPDGTRVIYWGAMSSAKTQDSPQAAYGDYSNAGVTTVQHGEAVVRFHCPAEYYVPWGKKLKRHLHYRFCCAKSGLIGPVKTLWVNC